MADETMTKKVTDLTESTEPTDEDLFLAGSAGTASLRKIKWSNIWTKITSSILNKLVANNLITTAAGFLLDARQGKVLDDKLTELNTKISSMYLERTTVTLTGESHAIEAPSIDGRVFMCWISASTREWVGSVYIENPSQTSTNVWKSVGAGGIVDCYALYRNS